MDLFPYYESQKQGYSPFTQAVHAMFALREALVELEDSGGWRVRHKRYAALSQRIREGLLSCGISPLLDSSAYCSMITSFHLPPTCTYQRLHDICREASFVIYAGQGDLGHSTFRLANMGDIKDDDVERLIRVFETIES